MAVPWFDLLDPSGRPERNPVALRLPQPSKGGVPTTALLPVVIFVLVIVLLSVGLRRLPRAALWLTGLLLPVFPLFSDTSDWDSWFDWVKRYSVIFPTFLWAFLHARPEQRFSRFLAAAMPYLLILNVLEAGFLDLLGANPLNGALVILVAGCVPLRWTREGDPPLLGFRDPLWQAAYSLTLARLYVLNPTFENSTAGLLIILVIASLLCLIQRDSRNYLTWRVYSLYIFILQDSIFPTLSDHLYPAWLHSSNRVQWQGTWLADLWLVLNFALVAALLFRRIWTRRGKSPINNSHSGSIA